MRHRVAEDGFGDIAFWNLVFDHLVREVCKPVICQRRVIFKLLLKLFRLITKLLLFCLVGDSVFWSLVGAHLCSSFVAKCFHSSVPFFSSFLEFRRSGGRLTEDGCGHIAFGNWMFDHLLRGVESVICQRCVVFKLVLKLI